MSSHDRSIKEELVPKALETTIDIAIASLMYFLLERFGLGITLPIFIFILIVVAPNIQKERLSLIAITFFSLLIDVVKEKKFQEAFIFICVVGVSVFIDEIIRWWRKGFSDISIQLFPKSPLLIDTYCGLLSAGIIYAYAIHEYSTIGSQSFFGELGRIILLAVNQRKFIFNPVLIVALAILPGATISAIVRKPGIVRLLKLITIHPFRSLLGGSFVGLFIFAVLQALEFLLLLLFQQVFPNVSTDANNVFLVPNFLVVHLLYAVASSPVFWEDDD